MQQHFNLEKLGVMKLRGNWLLTAVGWYFNEEKKGKNLTILADEQVIVVHDRFHDRIDVKNHFNKSNALSCGFDFCVFFPKGTKKISFLDAQRDVILYEIDVSSIGETKENLFEVFIENIFLDYNLRPTGKPNLIFKGWAVPKIQNVTTFALCLRKKRKIYPLKHGELREDVKRVFPNLPSSEFSGFNGEIPLPTDQGQIEIIAAINGEEIVLASYTLNDLPAKNKKNGFNKRFVAYSRLIIKMFRKGWYVYSKKHKYRISLRQLREYLNKARGYASREFQKAEHFVSSGFQKNDTYPVWVKNNQISSRMMRQLSEVQTKFSYRPLISIVIPVYNVKQKWLEKAIDSIENQIYDNWEVCIADDCSTLSETIDLLGKLETKEKFKVCFRAENGNISEASNTAADLASGEYIVLMDNDDELAPNALFEIVSVLQANKEVDILYSDDDKIDENGVRYAPQFKPDWSPELLLSYMYISHLFCFRTTLFRQVGGFRKGFEGTQDYDLALRITEKTSQIHHIPKILYHWRAIEGSTALTGSAKPEAFEKAQLAIAEALERRNVKGKVYWPKFAQANAIGMFGLDFPDDGPSVSIIVPTKNQYSILKRCIDSLQKTTYKNYEIVIIDNDSDDPIILDYFKEIPHRVLKISNKENIFSYAYINNEAVKNITSDFILFLNNDTEVIEKKWLSKMMGYQNMYGVGAVGARLLYPDNRVQHAGVVIGIHDGLAGHAFKLTGDWDPGYLGYSRTARNYSAVTAACILTKRDYFEEVGGFDEELFSVAYNDVDYCLKLRKIGKRIVYVPDAILYHHEGVSRGFIDNPQEVINFKEKYNNYKDPYYNVNLSLLDESFNIKTSCTLSYENYLSYKPKLLMVGFNLNFEGAPIVQYQLAKGLVSHNIFEIEIFCPQDGPLRKAYQDLGIKVHIFAHPLQDVYTIQQYSENMDRFSSWIGTQGFDLVYANTLQTFYVIDAARISGVPSIWNIHESEDLVSYFDFLPAQVSNLASRVIEYPYKTVFVAHATAQIFEKYNVNDSFDVIHNGLMLENIHVEITRDDARRELGIHDSRKVYLIVGTVTERKGQLDFVKAAKKIVDEGAEDAEFFIVGGRASDYFESLVKYIKNNGLDSRVTVVMETDRVAPYYRAADVFVCCSYNESYPMVILEAMAFGIPIITTSVFGIREQVQNNVNALLYSEGDILTLTDHMKRLYFEDDLRRKFARNSRLVLACNTSYEEMVIKYQNIMLEAIQIDRY
ncbi:hypothetical protein PPYC1_02900 [Paenibacillus polymyxa]|uniref:glycosyltransferase n=1 Tax=Paenibacillus polymyxa TaxID=1406 RepID=UPI0008FC6647|nr:glycosyltransferase [Paenibacillus polymyxa]APB69397.1 hypothetical protein PPYC1_02900 [Paenibacillus polymyxa]